MLVSQEIHPQRVKINVGMNEEARKGKRKEHEKE